MFQLDSVQGYFIHLLSCALNSQQPQEKPDNVSFNDVFALAQNQLFANLAWVSVAKLNNKPSQELAKKWETIYSVDLMRCATQLFELDYLVDSFTAKGFDVMPLKGSVIRNYYPVPDMRTMSDIDLLVKTQDKQTVREILASCGYDLIIPDDGQVDTFEKKPHMYIDLHYSLMAENHHYQEHFQDTWQIAIPTDTKGVYALSFEDMYVYNVGHYAKHMFSSGTGMRCVVDAYVMWKAATDEQKQLINEKLKEKELFVFNQQLVKIADIWFAGANDDGTTDDIQKYFLKTSTYGNIDSVDAIKLINENGEDISKVAYYKKRIFPGADYLYKRYNIKRRIPLLLPFLWIYRVVSMIFVKDRVMKEFSATNNVSQQDIDSSRTLYKKLGLIK